MGRVYRVFEFRSIDRDQDFVSGTMSIPSGPGAQELVPRTIEDMEVNGGEQAAVVPRVQEPTEEATGPVSSREQPGTSSQGQEQPDPSAQGPSVVDQRVFVHAPHYH